MKPLPLLLCGAALVWGAACYSQSARADYSIYGPPAEFAAPLPGGASGFFGDGTEHPWPAPPLPPLPAADLWEDYQAPSLCHKLHRAHRHGCPHSRGPVLGLVGDVLDGFLSLLTLPARKIGGRHGCDSGDGHPALRDCGCHPPASPAPSWIPDEPTPLPPRNEVPRLLPPSPLPEAEGEGLAPARPVAPAPQAEPNRLYPGRAPVVELAPDLNVPLEPGALPKNSLPPKNTVPKPGEGLPRNVIPPR